MEAKSQTGENTLITALVLSHQCPTLLLHALLLRNLIDLTDELLKVTHAQLDSPASSIELPSLVSGPSV